MRQISDKPKYIHGGSWQLKELKICLTSRWLQCLRWRLWQPVTLSIWPPAGVMTWIAFMLQVQIIGKETFMMIQNKSFLNFWMDLWGLKSIFKLVETKRFISKQKYFCSKIFYSAAKNIDQFFGDIGLAAESLEPRFFNPAGWCSNLARASF